MRPASSSPTSAPCSARRRCASCASCRRRDAPPGSPVGVVVTGSRALAGVRVALEQRRGSIWKRVGAGTLKAKGARVKLMVKLPRHASVRAVFTGSEAVAAGVSGVRTRRA